METKVQIKTTTISIWRPHTSAKVANLTKLSRSGRNSIKIPGPGLWFGSAPKLNSLLLLRYYNFKNNFVRFRWWWLSPNFIHNFLRYPADRQIDKDRGVPHMTCRPKSGPPGIYFHPAREDYEACWHCTTWEVLWISCQTDWWFPDLRISENTLTSWSYWEIPFKLIPCDTAVKYQMELTDIQNDSDLKRAFSKQDLLSFDRGYVSSDSYPNLSQDAKNFTALFGSTYCSTAASNCFWEWKKKQKQNQVRSLLRTFDSIIAYFDFYCWSRYRLLIQT